MENDEQFEEELTSQVKIDMRNLKNPQNYKNPKNLHFNGLLLTKVYNVVMFDGTEH